MYNIWIRYLETMIFIRLRWCRKSVLCIVGVPTLNLIQAARTKVFLPAGFAGKHWRITNTYRTCAVGTGKKRRKCQHEFTQCWLERRKVQMTGITFNDVVRTREFQLTGITFSDAVGTIAIRINFLRKLVATLI